MFRNGGKTILGFKYSDKWFDFIKLIYEYRISSNYVYILFWTTFNNTQEMYSMTSKSLIIYGNLQF